MELYKKIREEIVNFAGGTDEFTFEDAEILAKECTKVALEEQISLLKTLGNYSSTYCPINIIYKELANLEQQLKSLEDAKTS